ncbi:MAG: hypothetical protein HY744_06700 [Deltaproteobacteria bacterium]|nr:hypothetical protein [Deltaproteobacteria bacterium]
MKRARRTSALRTATRLLAVLAVAFGSGNAAAAKPPETAAQKAAAEKAAAELEQKRNDALRLGGEGLDLFTAGDYGAALERFKKADELVPAPTLKLRVARCLDRLARLREAAEAYRQVIAMELAPDAPEVHRRARDEAVAELTRVIEQTPVLVVTLHGAKPEQTEMELDGEPLAADRLGQPVSLDPGRHSASARHGKLVARQEVTLKRSERKLVVLRPVALATAAAAPAARASPWRTVGWVAIGLGGAALDAGIIAGLLVLTEEDDLLANCPDRRCSHAYEDDVLAFNATRTFSTASCIAGAAVLAGGAALVLLHPLPEAGGDAGVALRLGPAGGSIGGRF